MRQFAHASVRADRCVTGTAGSRTPRATSEDSPQTWHYGLVAQWWAEFNDDFRAHEIPYFQRFIERNGQPALDVACGTGRLLLPYLRAGLDVDGCDVSADMVASCREKAEREGLSPNLYVQPVHELNVPRRYRTIYVCGAFGLGSDRERDRRALERLHEHLEPGGTLLLDKEMPYADARQWKYWVKTERAALPETAESPQQRRRTSDGSELGLRSRLLEVDPLRQHVVYEMRAERWRDGTLEEAEIHRLDDGLYFRHELLLLLERAGFVDVVVHGEHEERGPTADDDFLVFVARRA
jgi:SAM-dependent methyltransferase